MADHTTYSIVWRPIDELIPAIRNPRMHDDAQVAQLVSSLKEFGWTNPVLIDESSGIIAGHGRLLAARRAHEANVAIPRCPDTSRVPTLTLVGLSDAQRRAYIIADNQLALNATWNDELLKVELDDLRQADYDLALTGFSEDELADILDEAQDGATDPNDVPDTAEDVPIVSKPGDIWIMGPHRLLCGDSRVRADVERVLAGDRAVCVFTDPPYGVAIGAKNRMLNEVTGGGSNEDDIQDDDLSPEELKTVLQPAFELVRELAMAPECTLFVCSAQGGDLGLIMLLMMKDAGLPVRHVLSWVKNAPTFSLGRLDYDYQHEPILMTWGKRHKRCKRGVFQTSIWPVDKPRACDLHPTMKPVELYVNAYLNHTDQGDVVYEPYAGSGTAFIAAHQTGRVCRGIEIEPKWTDTIVRRWEEFTGQKAVLKAASAVEASA